MKTENQEPLIKVENISKKFPNGKESLSNINFEIYKNDFILIAGSNGSGKTVLMNIIANLEKASSGKIINNSKEFNLNSHIGIIFQDADSQILGETPEEDILFGLKASKAKDKLITFGLIRELVLNEKIVEGFLASDKPIEAFSKFYRDIQYMNAYSAKQRFYRNTDTEEIFGMYTLTQETRTILPYEPSVEFRNLDTAKDDDVKNGRYLYV